MKQLSEEQKHINRLRKSFVDHKDAYDLEMILKSYRKYIAKNPDWTALRSDYEIVLATSGENI